ncbi:hypothetical protein BDK51DRAFT_29250 [Blyttiomyces helicus]|uniref:Uncharacterized protein n=1 Tax=Blyttiomyces helicus TaxID=388810 RepID=A0A4P9WNF8_9FUNG|nr:hypothetical protein BDK51DRAFT_29250 [Blyttiomyces helicus]|eukprot:RKO93228.1 hypothetical protein BDK51DRAFT_29250 [Blyttiomyces helicus]
MALFRYVSTNLTSFADLIQLAHIKNERHEFQIKTDRLMADLERDRKHISTLDKEKTTLEREKAVLEKEKAALDKELKKVNGVISKAKEKQALQNAMDENSKLRSEIELLSDQKLQNQALKDNIHQIVARADKERRELEEKIASLAKELREVTTSRATLDSALTPAMDEAKPLPPYSVRDTPPAEVAAAEILQAEVRALEMSVRELRTSKVALESSLETSARELQEAKAELEAERKRSGQDSAGGGPSAGTTGSAAGSAAGIGSVKSWWSRASAGTNAAQPAAATAGAKSSAPRSPATATEDTSSKSLAEAAPTPVAVAAPEPAQAAAAVPANNVSGGGAANSWWSRTPAAAGGTASSTAAGADQTKLIEELREERNKLEEQLKTAADETAGLKRRIEEIEAQKWGATPPAVDAPSPAATPTKSSEVGSDLATLVEELRRERAALQEQLHIAANETASFKQRIEELEKSRAAPADAPSPSSPLVSNPEKDDAKLIENLQEERGKLQDQPDGTVLEADALKKRMEKLEHSRAEELREQRGTLQEQLAVAVDESASLKKRVEELERSCEAAVSTGDSSRQELEQLRGERSALEDQLRSTAEETATLKHRLVELDLAAAQAPQTEQSHPDAARVEDLEKQLISRQKEIESALKEIASLKADLEAASLCRSESEAPRQDEAIPAASDVAAMEAQLDRVKHEFEAERQGLLQQVSEARQTLDERVRVFEDQERSSASDAAAATESVSALEARMAETQRQFEFERDSLAQARSSLEAAERRAGELEGRLATEREAMMQAQAEALREAKARDEEERGRVVDELTRQLATLQARLDALSASTSADAAKASEEIALAHRNEVVRLEDRLKNLGDEISAQKGENARLRSLHEAAAKETVSRQEEVARSIVELSALRARSSEIEEKLTRKEAEVSAAHKAAEAHKKELETLQRKMGQNKEANDILVRTLQERIQMTEGDKTTIEKKIKAEMEDRIKKEKAEVEERHKREKTEWDDKLKRKDAELKEQRNEWDDKLKRKEAELKEKMSSEEKLRKEKEKLTADLEKSKKDHQEMSKKFEKELVTKGEDLAKQTQRARSLEQEAQTLRSDYSKTQAEMFMKQQETERARAHEDALRAEIDSGKEQVAALQSRNDLLTAELEVAHASVERASRSYQEKEDVVKKAKSRAEELAASESALRKSLARTERERDEAVGELAAAREKVAAMERTVASLQEEAVARKSSGEARTIEAEQNLAALKVEMQTLKKKLQDLESENKISERKSAQIIKDLQKQLAKERKQNSHEDPPEASAPPPQQLPQEISPVVRSNADLAKASKTGHSGSGESVGVPKVERLTDDLLHLAQENESLNRRARVAEEELRAATERVTKLSDELKSKTSTLQQYVLRDHALALQPDEKPRGGFNMNILSSGPAMQRMDPVMLSEINTKMQKLLARCKVQARPKGEEVQQRHNSGQDSRNELLSPFPLTPLMSEVALAAVVKRLEAATARLEEIATDTTLAPGLLCPFPSLPSHTHTLPRASSHSHSSPALPCPRLSGSFALSRQGSMRE